jgi:hypothetical protein
MSNAQPLWSDERIRQHLTMRDQQGTPSKAHTAFAVLMDMRDEYEARLSEANARIRDLEILLGDK